MNSKISLFNRTKDFIYSPDLEDLHVFSKEYLNSILKPYYSSILDKKQYAAICIDFNKLNDINSKYGYHTGDRIIHYCLFLIQSVLPSNSISARMGGDEFVFLIDNCTLESIDPLISKINTILKKHEKELLFSSVTSYGIHSKEVSNLTEMFTKADLKITEQKNNFNEYSSNSNWEILENKLNQNLTSFFKSLRLYKKPITAEFLKKLYMHTISSCSDLLEKNYTKVVPNIDEHDIISTFNNSELWNLHSIFSKESPSAEEINSIDENTFNCLLDSLIHDPLTGNFSKSYFVKYLLEDCKEEFRVKYISTSFMKLFNTIFSHDATDVKVNEMITDFLDYLEKDLHITFSDNVFSNRPENYFVSLGGGDFLIAIQDTKQEQELNNKINNYLSSIHQDTSDLSNILKLFCSKNFHTMSSENYDSLLSNLSDECKEEKNIYKISILEEPFLKDSLNNIIYDSSQFYINNIPNSNNITNMHHFLHLLTKVMLNISIKLNKEQEEKAEEK